MDSFCDTLLLAIFRFVRPDDRIQFIMLGRKYCKVVSEYIASPEWIYEQIDQFIKKNAAVNFSLKCDAPSEYLAYLREHDPHRRGIYGTPNWDVANNFFAQQLGIDVMTCAYESNRRVSADCCCCIVHNWLPRPSVMHRWNLHSMQSAPSDYLSSTDQNYHDSVIIKLLEQPNVNFYVYWSAKCNHVSTLNIVGDDGRVGLNTDRCTCVNGSIIPIHSVYESIGIIVHNMTGIKQIHKKLLDYDLEHLQLFYIINFMSSSQLSGMPYGLRNVQSIGTLRYSAFVEHILQNCVRKDVEMLLAMNRFGPSKYVFMIHPEIESKAADAAKYIFLFIRQHN